MSERRACKAIGCCRMTVRYQTSRSDDREVRERMPDRTGLGPERVSRDQGRSGSPKSASGGCRPSFRRSKLRARGWHHRIWNGPCEFSSAVIGRERTSQDAAAQGPSVDCPVLAETPRKPTFGQRPHLGHLAWIARGTKPAIRKASGFRLEGAVTQVRFRDAPRQMPSKPRAQATRGPPFSQIGQRYISLDQQD